MIILLVSETVYNNYGYPQPSGQQANYGPENPPSYWEQYYFFNYALAEAELDPGRQRWFSGPVYPLFNDVLKRVRGWISDIDPSLPDEVAIPSSYQSAETRTLLKNCSDAKRQAILDLTVARVTMLEKLGLYELMNIVGPQSLPEGTFDISPYCRQGEELSPGEAAKLCTNACFRMTFGGITGWLPSEEVLTDQIRWKYGEDVVDDSIYYNLFQTEIFSEVSKARVATVEILGADLDYLAGLTAKLRQRGGAQQVYCIVNLGSESVNNSIWHACVLLEASRDRVVCHDPSVISGKAQKEIAKSSFVERWAATYNRARLVIVSDRE